MNELRERMRKIIREGCGDSSCPRRPPGGMRTNGGCRCVDNAIALLREAYDIGLAHGSAPDHVP